MRRCVRGTQYAAKKSITPVINQCVDAILRKSPYKRYIVGLDGWMLYCFTWLPLWLQEFFVSGPLKPFVTPNGVKNRKKKTKYKKLKKKKINF